MVYHHRKVTREMFERYRRRYSPYAGGRGEPHAWATSSMNVPGATSEILRRKGEGGEEAVGQRQSVRRR